jgi:hypothetical protein
MLLFIFWLSLVFLSGSEYVMVYFYCLFISVLPFEIQLSRGIDHINGFTPPTFLFLSQARIKNFTGMSWVFFCGQEFWYWLNCWPSLFNLVDHQVKKTSNDCGFLKRSKILHFNNHSCTLQIVIKQFNGFLHEDFKTFLISYDDDHLEVNTPKEVKNHPSHVNSCTFWAQTV